MMLVTVRDAVVVQCTGKAAAFLAAGDLLNQGVEHALWV
jgi:hypothetical protein